jgi:thymidine kinase
VVVISNFLFIKKLIILLFGYNIILLYIELYIMLNLIIGPMFSGKSTELLRRYRRYKISGKKCLLIKYSEDNRYDENMIVTHDNIKYNAHKCSDLKKINELILDYDVILIDEIQFYQNINICDEWANNKIVEVSGLNGKFDRSPWDNITYLIPKVDNITYLTAICAKTGNDAPFTKRLNDDKNDIIIGGTDTYIAVSRKEYFN